MPSAILWDMDGTLINSEPLWAEATFYLSEKVGRRLTPTERLATVGATFSDTLRICADIAGVELDPADEPYYRALTFDYVKNLYTDNLEVFPGIVALLEELKAQGMPMMVATNTEREVADPALEALGMQYFVDTICGDEVASGKPAPDMYVEAAARLGVDPSRCLVFEDSTAGMTAALDAGCRVIGLPEGEHVHVPRGAVTISTLHNSHHLDGADAAAISRWWEEITR